MSMNIEHTISSLPRAVNHPVTSVVG
jgi:hypothetical protein